MFEVYYFSYEKDPLPELIHSDYGGGNKLTRGTYSSALNEVSTFSFSLNLDNTAFGKIRDFRGRIRVDNAETGETIFYGRILEPTSQMTATGLYSGDFIAEDALSYLNDSIQPHYRFVEPSPANLVFASIVDRHNDRMGDEKQLTIGYCDITDNLPVSAFYVGYNKSIDAMRELIEMMGGYIRTRHVGGVNYIDWLERPGISKRMPIEVGDNLRSASKSINYDELVTRVIPLGKDTGTETVPEGETAINPRLGIANVNEGRDYADDANLVNLFGVVEGILDLPDITDPVKLHDEGRRFFESQKAFLSSWQVDVVDLSYIDNRYEPFKLGNTHPIVNPPISGVEELSITELSFDISSPQNVTLMIGEKQKGLSDYYVEMSNANESIKTIRRRMEGTT